MPIAAALLVATVVLIPSHASRSDPAATRWLAVLEASAHTHHQAEDTLAPACIDQFRGILPDSDVVIAYETLFGSGAHDHDDGGDADRPQGVLDPVSGNTGVDGMQFRMEFTVLQAVCTPPDGVQIVNNFLLGTRVQGLQRLPDLMGFQLTGGTAAHPLATNHFGTTRLNSSIAVLAVKYKSAFPSAPDLRINDQSLEEGGLFDIGPRQGSFWKTPHKAHRFGVDIGLVARKRVAALRQLALDDDVGFLLFLPEGDHYHLRVTGGPR